MINIKVVPLLAASVKNPSVPVPPTADCGERPGFESGVPLVWRAYSSREGDSHCLFFNKFGLVWVSHWAKEVCIWVSRNRDQDFLFQILQKEEER